MSPSIQRDGWLRTSLVSMARRRADIAFLPLLSSSTRVSARDGVDEKEGGGSGPNGFWGEDFGEDGGKVVSGEAGGLGNHLGLTNNPSKG